MDTSLSGFLINPDEFITDFHDKEKYQLKAKQHSQAQCVLQTDSVTLYTKKSILFHPNIPFNDENAECFKGICEKLIKINHPCAMNISYISFPQEKGEMNPSIYTVFKPYSLLQLIEKERNYDQTKAMLILYGISRYLQYLHKTAAHGGLKLSNVLLDSNYFPHVSDPYFYEIYQKMPKSSVPNTIDNIVHLSKETLSDGTIDTKTDIYSFGILALQVLTHKVNVFQNDNVEELKKRILSGVRPVQLDYINGEIKSLIESCLISNDPNKRPDASNLVKSFEKILFNERVFDKKLVEDFQQYLNINEEIHQIEDIIVDKKENMDQQNLQEENKTCDEIKNDQQNLQEENKTCDEIKNDQQNLQKDDDQFEKQLVTYLNKKHLIFPDEAKKRITTLYNYLKDGDLVLLNGPIGTSKKLTSEIVCEISGRKMIRFNCMEFRSFNLLQKYNINMNFKSLFIAAFKEGHTLILEDIEHINSEYLQFIEKSIENGTISENENQQIHKHENFRLIIIQNKDSISQNSQNSRNNFLSKFKIINFPLYSRNELVEIVENLAKNLKYVYPQKFIEDLVDFHITLSKIGNHDFHFLISIHEIVAIIHAITAKENIYEAVTLIYGSKCTIDKKSELEKMFLSFSSFKFSSLNQHALPKEFRKQSYVLDILRSILFFFKNNRNIILKSDPVSSLTNFIKSVEKYYFEFVKKKNQSDTESFDLNTKLIKNIANDIQNGQIDLFDGICGLNITLNQKNFTEVDENIGNNAFNILLTYNSNNIEEIYPCLTCNFEIIIKNKVSAEDLFFNEYQCFRDQNSSHTHHHNLWCIDCSGSVGGSDLYHGELESLLSRYDTENDEFYLWDHEYHQSSLTGINYFVSNRIGRGGTSSELIADICLQSSNRNHLIIVTDGCVDESSIDKSD